ncbi:MAG: tRNA (adenosine(37)-N6)-threonylcarbamoyltransferase complex dimerization subunit type 1 TsaB [Dehalococcoidia bacterium]|jgi:tRNA threonylcarbamoyladenosine biosynthesis protein TsaB|nr:tRNA (adenosine(37)-N6)-threonylcarbamoyltransferase complex dimerization subunit type 1 TsaB [Dehalococcoidia bacterium]
MELVLDASSPSTLVGVGLRGRLAWTSAPIASQEHTLKLVPEVVRGLEETSSAPADIELITVALGPGAFNALRVAVSAAKGFAMGTGAALVGIETLLAEALRCPQSARRVRPVLRAARAGFATAVFAWQEAQWLKVEEERFVDEATLAQLADAETPLCGDDAADVCEQLRLAYGIAVSRVPPASVSHLEALAAAGWARYRAGDVTPAATLQPLYVRPPHITLPRDRR